MTAEEVRDHLGRDAKRAAVRLFYADSEAAARTNRRPRFLKIQDARTAMNKGAGFQSVSQPDVSNDDIRRSIELAKRLTAEYEKEGTNAGRDAEP